MNGYRDDGRYGAKCELIECGRGSDEQPVLQPLVQETEILPRRSLVELRRRCFASPEYPAPLGSSVRAIPRSRLIRRLTSRSRILLLAIEDLRDIEPRERDDKDAAREDSDDVGALE